MGWIQRGLAGATAAFVTTDDAAQATKTLEDYENELEDAYAKLDTAYESIGRMREQRDTAVLLLDSLTTTTTRASGTAVRPPMVSGGHADDTDGDQDETGGAEPRGEADG